MVKLILLAILASSVTVFAVDGTDLLRTSHHRSEFNLGPKFVQFLSQINQKFESSPRIVTRRNRFGKVITTSYPSVSDVLSQYEIIIAPGFMGDLVEDIRKTFSWQNMGNYFSDFIDFFQNRGVANSRLTLASFTTDGERNIRVIKQKILDAALHRKKVIIIAHSKGNLDTLQTLLDNTQLLKHVAGWIALQGPFWGSTKADGNFFFERLGLKLLYDDTTTEGIDAALLSLSPTYRVPFMHQKMRQIRNLNNHIPIISVATCYDREGEFHFDWPKSEDPLTREFKLDRSRIVPREGNCSGDGTVPFRSAYFPDSYHIFLTGADHLITVIDWFSDLGPFDREKFLKALLWTMLDHVETSKFDMQYNY